MNNTTPWFSYSLERCFQRLNSSPDGLTTADARRRIEQYGVNEIQRTVRRTPLRMLVHQFADTMILILIAAAFSSIIFIGAEIWKIFKKKSET